MEKQRKSGILLPIAALPSEYAIGDFGSNAEAFIDFMTRTGFSVWQILPITTIGSGNSPYSGHSAFGGNYQLIDISRLPERLLSNEEKQAAKYHGSIYSVNYDYAKEKKKFALKTAFGRLNDDDWASINEFCRKNDYWIKDYALYRAFKESHGNVAWYDWEEGLYFRDEDAMKKAEDEHNSQIRYYYFEQFVFDKQWKALRKYANARGIKIFGDMPIYVDIDSADVWSKPELFQLDERKRPTRVAGVPPDYFAKDGQLWGNPLYNYKKMATNGYEWWIQRLLRNLDFYDILRIDHFRGLCEYWSVPAGAKTAREGRWEEGCGTSLWKALYKVIHELNIVAEDLGDIDDKVRDYLKATGFPGMRVLQFAFDGTQDNPHLPYNYDRNTVAYTATHDNNTTLGWLYSLSADVRNDVLEYLDVSEQGWGNGGGKCPSTRGAIKAVLSSVANLAVIPLQDLAGYGADTRTNTPGVPTGNWEVRATTDAINEIDENYYRRLNSLYGR